jgi:hypothetical protein
MISGAGISLGGLAVAGVGDRPNTYHRAGGDIAFGALDVDGDSGLTAQQYQTQAGIQLMAMGAAGECYHTHATQAYDSPAGPDFAALEAAGECYHTPVSTGDYYVSPGGDNGDDGSAGSPWRTIQKAADTAESGKTVVVLPGTYQESVHLDNANGVNFQGSGWPHVYAPNTAYAMWSTSAVHDITIEGFEISGPERASTAAGIMFDGCDRWTIRGNRIHDCERFGVRARSGDNTLIESNHVYSILYHDESMGIRTEKCISAEVAYNACYLIWKNGARDIRSRRSYYHHNNFWGMYTGFALNYSATGLLFENNYLHHCTNGAQLKHANGTDQPYLDDNIIRYNTFYRNSYNDVGIGINASAVDHLYVERNFFDQAGDCAVRIHTAYTLTDINVDENLYRKVGTRPHLHWYDVGGGDDCTAVSQIKSDTPFETNGVEWAGSQAGYGATAYTTACPGWSD